jgi:glycosyltransferase involved in cell wall biosynthesis
VKRFFKTDFIPLRRLRGVQRDTRDGVDILMVPIFKFLPHTRFSARTIRKHARFVEDFCAVDGFVPDAIICHFLNPQLPLIEKLHAQFPAAKTSLVLHEDPKEIVRVFGSQGQRLIGNLDYLGFRYEAMRARYIADHGSRPGLFLCPSGIPERFIPARVPVSKFASQPLTICFVGMLIPLKNVDILLRAVHRAFPNKDVRLRIIGEGFLKPSLIALSVELGLDQCVRFDGRISREDVQHALREADVFVMVSNPEAFGLVYLEAMAKGCITIGTIGQGVDGVIVSGQNGFLCEPRDITALSDLLRDIAVMPRAIRWAIAEAARRTAEKHSDSRVAELYLESLGFQHI